MSLQVWVRQAALLTWAELTCMLSSCHATGWSRVTSEGPLSSHVLQQSCLLPSTWCGQGHDTEQSAHHFLSFGLVTGTRTLPPRSVGYSGLEAQPRFAEWRKTRHLLMGKAAKSPCKGHGFSKNTAIFAISPPAFPCPGTLLQPSEVRSRRRGR